jgi:hypothetical protein
LRAVAARQQARDAERRAHSRAAHPACARCRARLALRRPVLAIREPHTASADALTQDASTGPEVAS